MSSLQQDMFMPANMYGTEAMAFMVDSANHFIACFARQSDQPHQQQTSAIKTNDWALESMATTDA